MRKRCTVWLFSLLLLFSTQAAAAELPEQVVAVGSAVGIDVQCQGLLVVDFQEDSPAKEGGLRKGDLILEADGSPVSRAEDLQAIVQNQDQVTLTVLRSSKQESFLIWPQESAGARRLGISVKSEMAGIGTITYYNPATGVFGALGHGITDGQSAELFPVKNGLLLKATVLHVEKGVSGSPGMLQGAFDSGVILGTVAANTPCGIFGTASEAIPGSLVDVADKAEIHTGDVSILCSVSGDTVETYSAKILRLYPISDGTGRNMLLKITDDKLVDCTGGIIQGMSGSPILQDGKLVGAVTHVLVSDPTCGYGIYIDSMLETAEELTLQKAS